MSEKTWIPDILTRGRTLHKFINITIIVLSSHDPDSCRGNASAQVVQLATA